MGALLAWLLSGIQTRVPDKEAGLEPLHHKANGGLVGAFLGGTMSLD